MKKILLLISIALVTKVNATHQVAGDIGWTCLGNNQYEFYIFFYKNCGSSVATAPSAKILVGTSSCGTINLTMNLVDLSPNDPSTMGIQDTTFIYNGYQTTCNGGIFPGVEIYKYVGITTLIPCADWFFCSDDCCRNLVPGAFAPLTPSFNFVGSSNAISGTMNNADGNCDDSPIWNTTPKAYICQNVLTSLDNGAYDPDGDSLVFQLVLPFDGCGVNTITYNPPFSATYPFTTLSGNFPFNSVNGLSTFTPAFISGAFEVTGLDVQILEYRNGILRGSIIRDIQIVTVQGCNPLNTQNFGIHSIGNQTSLFNDTLKVYAGDTLDFSVIISDNVNQDSFNISNTLINLFPTTEFIVNYLQNFYTLEARTVLLTDNSYIGTYDFNLIARNNGIVLIEQNYAYVLQVLPNPNASINSLIGKEKFKIYPNPTSGELNVVLPENSRKAKISIFDIAGKEYFSKRLNGITSTIDLDIPKGVYFVKIESGRSSVVKKLIIE